MLGDLSGVAHCIFGFLGIVGGALAATAAGAGWPKWLAVLGGVLAAVASGAAALFDLERRAEAHWESAAVLRAAAEYVENKRACLGPEADACLS